MTESLVTVYTTAPAEYDYSYVTVLEECSGHSKGAAPKTYRKVSFPASRERHACGRYGSGLHPALPESEWAKLVEYGLVTLPE